jgi:hypothetical protein
MGQDIKATLKAINAELLAGDAAGMARLALADICEDAGNAALAATVRATKAKVKVNSIDSAKGPVVSIKAERAGWTTLRI